MESYLILPNKNIFAAYVGLTVSGYNLAEENYIKELPRRLE